MTFAVLTTVAAFSPLLFVPGMMGKIFRVIPLVVIPCLLFSLVESLNILPAHLSHPEARPSRAVARRFQSPVRGRPEALRAGGLLAPCSRRRSAWRYLTASIGVGVMIVTIGLMPLGAAALPLHALHLRPPSSRRR